MIVVHLEVEDGEIEFVAKTNTREYRELMKMYMRHLDARVAAGEKVDPVDALHNDAKFAEYAGMLIENKLAELVEPEEPSFWFYPDGKVRDSAGNVVDGNGRISAVQELGQEVREALHGKDSEESE